MLRISSVSKLLLGSLLLIALVSTGLRAQTVYTVWNTDDDGTGSLRQAILDANTSGSGIIEFDIDNPSGDVLTIALKSELPDITQPGVTVDGISQTDARCESLISGTEHKLFIVLDGSGLPAGSWDGIRVDAAAHDVKISGLVIHSFSHSGVYSQGLRTIVSCSYIGTDVAGTTDQGNGWRGAELLGAGSMVENSLVSGNDHEGIRLAGDRSKAVGNLVGTNVNGTGPVANTLSGIIVQADSVTIGGTASVEANLLAGNGGNGVAVDVGLVGCVVNLNLIGTDLDGLNPVANGLHGIQLGSGCTIGSLVTGGGNLISGNAAKGIDMTAGAVGSYIAGNLIGTDITGGKDIGNGETGISAADSTIIVQNVISGNDRRGVILFGNGCEVDGNMIGTDFSGTSSVPNEMNGVEVLGNGARIGASTLNVISGNRQSGIFVWRVYDTLIQDNVIGLRSTLNLTLENDFHGIQDFGDSTQVMGNYIGGNKLNGIDVAGQGKTIIQGNYIGTNASGTIDFGNDGHGIVADSAGIIGGLNASDGNVIAFNGLDGVMVTQGTVPIVGNYIHENDGLGIDLLNNGVTANDPGDVDGGPNDLQNFPTIFPVLRRTPDIKVWYLLETTPLDSFYVEVFVSPTDDPSGHGEGALRVAASRVKSKLTGEARDTLYIPETLLPVGHFVTMTATRVEPSGALGGTSEFSEAEEVVDRFYYYGNVFLEGPYVGGGLMAPTPAFFSALPTQNPFDDDDFNGTLLEYDDPVNPSPPPAETTDWVVVSLRSSTAPGTEVWRQPLFVRDDGHITTRSGSPSVPVSDVPLGEYHVVVCQRNHLCAMSDSLVDFSSGVAWHDFTNGNAYTVGPAAQKVLSDGEYGLFAGNAVPDTEILESDYDTYILETTNGVTGWPSADFNCDSHVEAGDYVLYLENAINDAASQVP
jgi:hypothetical protein